MVNSESGRKKKKKKSVLTKRTIRSHDSWFGDEHGMHARPAALYSLRIFHSTVSLLLISEREE